MYRQSENLPDEIRAIVYAGGSNLTQFAEQICKLKFTRVHSILARSQKKQIENLKSMAGVLGITVQELVEIITIEDMARREAAVDKLLSGMTRNRWAVLAKLESSTVRVLLENREHKNLNCTKKVIEKLNLSFDKFADIYEI